MSQKKIVASLKFLYLVASFLVIFFVTEENRTIQLYIKPFVIITLFSIYALSIKKINYLYIGMLVSSLLGHMFLIYPEKYFTLCVFSYFSMHIFGIILVFKHFLTKKSWLDIFTFSLPFLIVFCVVFILLKDNLGTDKIPIILIGMAAVSTGSLVLLNYSQKKNLSNYLIFLGLFTIISAESSGALFKYAEKGVIFYYFIVCLDQLGQYALCMGILINEQEKNNYEFL